MPIGANSANSVSNRTAVPAGLVEPTESNLAAVDVPFVFKRYVNIL